MYEIKLNIHYLYIYYTHRYIVYLFYISIIYFIIITSSVPVWFFYWSNYLLRLLSLCRHYIIPINQFIKYIGQNRSLFLHRSWKVRLNAIRKLCGRSLSRVNYARACSSTTAMSPFLRHPPVAHRALYPRLPTLLFVTHAFDASAWSAWLASHSRPLHCSRWQRARL